MIHVEDIGAEEEFFENQPSIFLPFSIKQDSVSTVITVIAALEDIAKETEARFSHDIFSSESLAFIDSRLRPSVKVWGYCPDKRVDSYILNFVSTEIDKSKIQQTTLMLKGKSMLENLTGGPIEEYEGFVDEAYFATVIDGRIVSLCAINSFGEDGGTADISIRTAPAYRGNGYGTSNVVAMTDYLINLGYRVAYNVSVNNKASAAVAKKAGFTQASKSYYYICYKED